MFFPEQLKTVILRDKLTYKESPYLNFFLYQFVSISIDHFMFTKLCTWNDETSLILDKDTDLNIAINTSF